MDEAALVEKLRAIEALFARSTFDGERSAAASARDRILSRLERLRAEQPPVEYRFTLADRWSRMVFTALVRRYGLEPYRRHRQRHTTVMVRAPQRFVDEILWPQYQALAAELHRHLHEVTDRIVARAVHADASDARETDEPAPAALTDGNS